VGGNAVWNPKELIDPKCGARRHSRKVRMQVPDTIPLQAQPDVNGLMKTKEIRLPPPFLQSFPRSARHPPLAHRSIDFADQGILFWQVMHPPDELFVPILFRFSNRPPDRVNVNFRALALELCYLAITERLAKRRKSLEEVGNLAHAEELTAGAAVATLRGRTT
jgi:hypothetical protein